MSRTEAIEERIETLKAICGIIENLEEQRAWYRECDENGNEKPFAEYNAEWNVKKVQIYDDLLDYLSKKAK